MMKLEALLTCAMVAFCAGLAPADLFVVADGDFESGGPVVDAQVNDSTVDAGWRGAGSGVVYDTVVDPGNTVLNLGSPAAGYFMQSFSTTNVTGEMVFKFDVKIHDDGVGVGTDSDNLSSIAFSLLGETNPWNGSQVGAGNAYLNQNKEHADILPVWPDADRTSIAGDPGSQPNLPTTVADVADGVWTTVSYTIDMGTGFNHAQGGTPGDPVAYLIFEFYDVYNWAGDYLYVDNVRFEAIPEPATMGLLTLGAAALAARRRRR